MLYRLIDVVGVITITRSFVRKRLPKDYAYPWTNCCTPILEDHDKEFYL